MHLSSLTPIPLLSTLIRSSFVFFRITKLVPEGDIDLMVILSLLLMILNSLFFLINLQFTINNRSWIYSFHLRSAERIL
jgi:hypothetical protein